MNILKLAQCQTTLSLSRQCRLCSFQVLLYWESEKGWESNQDEQFNNTAEMQLYFTAISSLSDLSHIWTFLMWCQYFGCASFWEIIIVLITQNLFACAHKIVVTNHSLSHPSSLNVCAGNWFKISNWKSSPALSTALDWIISMIYTLIKCCV